MADAQILSSNVLGPSAFAPATLGHERLTEKRQSAAWLHLVDRQHIRMHDRRRRLSLAANLFLASEL